MYSWFRTALFQLDEERAHALCLSALHYVPNLFLKQPQGKEVHALGLTFPHAVGLAAGLDKNGDHLDALAKLGFSFIELGTVTPRPQIGNPKPRLFRLPQAQAIINRMGFNNKGVHALLENVQRADYRGILGINIGKNKDTDLNKAADDYLYCLRCVYQYASYITINISSPNTPDLRQLQQGDFFSDLLAQLQQERVMLTEKYARRVPLLIKVSPDEREETLKHMVDAILHYQLDGIIATNTTCRRDSVIHLPHANEQGGLSGKPLEELSTHSLRLIRQYAGDELTLIGVGGIDSLQTAENKIAAGANLLQIYTGLIYQGPGLVSRLVQGLNADH
jgi:dihydroorotate dehydrogenase